MKELSLGNRLEFERKRMELTQAEFGQMGGVSRLAQWKYEHDENYPSVKYLEKLRDAHVDIVYLLTGGRLPQHGTDKVPKEKTYPLRLTESELNLLWVEMRTSVDCGAEDPGFVTLRDKSSLALKNILRQRRK